MIKSKKQMYITMFIVAVVSGLLTWAVNNFIVYGVTDQMTGKFRTATSIIKRYGYNEVTDAALQEGSIHGLVDSLNDPYSAYLTAEEVADFEKNYASEYVGLGISTTKIISGYMVVAVAADSPAEVSDLQVNDIIIRVNDEEIAADDTPLSTMLYENKPLASLTVLRDNEEKVIEIIEAQVDFSQSISSVYEENGKHIMVFDMQRFTDRTAELLKKDLQILEEQSKNPVVEQTDEQTETSTVNPQMPQIDAVIFDFRNNEGGTVNDATKIIDQLIPSDFAAVSIEKRQPDEATKTNKDKDQSTDKNAVDNPNWQVIEGNNKFKEFPIKVPTIALINEKTASSAEMVAQALERASGVPLVGNTSAGKSTIQEIKKMVDGSGIKLTTGRWFGVPLNEEYLDVSKNPLTPLAPEDKVIDSYPFTVSSIGASSEYVLGDSDKNASETIARVQMTLNFFEYDIKRADGLFDEETEKAVSQFQKDNGIEVTGTINRDVLFILNKKLNNYTSNDKNDVTLQRGLSKATALANEVPVAPEASTNTNEV